MRLSPHFMLHEFTRSQTATRKGIDNRPTQEQLRVLTTLANDVLEPLRTALQHSPIIITSGYRSVELCEAIGSSSTSMHTFGAAADIEVIGFAPRHVARIAAGFLDAGVHSNFGRVILEYPEDGWVHIECKHPMNENRDGPLLEANRMPSGDTRYVIVDGF